MSGFKRASVKGGQPPRNSVFASLRETQIIKSKPILPAEILSQVLDYCTPACLIRCARVSRRLHEMAYDDSRWVQRLSLMGCWDEAEARSRRAETLQKQFGGGPHHQHKSTASGGVNITFTNPGGGEVRQGSKENGVLFDATTSPTKDPNQKQVDIPQQQNGKDHGSGIKDLREGFEGIDLAAHHAGTNSSSPGKFKDPVMRLNIFKTVRSIRGQARREYGRVYAALWPFYKDAVTAHSHTHAKVFRTYRDPQQQATMLANIRRFGDNDVEPGWKGREGKVEQLIAAFESAVMKEFEAGIAEKDVEGKMKKYAHVLCALGHGNKAVEMVIESAEILKQQQSLGDPVYCLDGNGDYQYENSFDFFRKVSQGFNEQTEIMGTVFPHDVDSVTPFLQRIGKGIIQDFLSALFHEAHRVYVDSYLKAVGATCQQCLNWANAVRPDWMDRDHFDKTAEELIASIFDPHVDLYLTEEVSWFKRKSETLVSDWERQLSEQDATMESMFMSNVNRQADKRDFLSSFKKVVMMPVNVLPTFQSKPATAKALVNGETLASNSQVASRSASPAIANATSLTSSRPITPLPEGPTTELAAKAAIMKNRLEGIRSLFSIEVALNLVHLAKSSIERAVVFSKLDARFTKDARLQCELIFISLLQTLGTRHVQPGFDQAVEHLSKYNPREVSEPNKQAGVTPLVTFLELVNVGDLIQQMLDVFYEQELVTAKLTDRNDFLNPAVKEKKRFEQMLDSRVAAGLNKGIEVLMDEVEYVCATTQKPEEFNPGAGVSSSSASLSAAGGPGSTANNSADVLDAVGPSPTAVQVVEIVSSHTKMLVGSTDKNTLDVFNQEVGMRLFTALCKHLKRQRISVSGSIKLISDVNLYHSYIVSLRNKDLLQFFNALRELSQIYLVDPGDAKALATIIADGDRFRGIFRAEEVYEYAERRADWYSIKGKVERAMYGIGCTLM